jgi:hypothetical protein
MKRYVPNCKGSRRQLRTAPGHRIRHEQKYLRQTLTVRGFARVAFHPHASMYVVELSIRLSPMPVAVQRKELAEAEALYGQVKEALETGHPRVLELRCEKEEAKRISLLSSELVAVQVYEKSAAGGSGKRPGFSFDG